MVYPERLKEGDVVAIVSPATEVKREYVEGAAEFLERQGFKAAVMPHACGPSDGSYAASLRNRADDLLAAWNMPEVKAILCARGGFGAAHILPLIPPEMVKRNPKWLIGFSDISALHAFLFKNGVASLHAPMAKHLTVEADNDPSTQALLRILTGDSPVSYSFSCDSFHTGGKARGRLVGGNFAVLDGLAGTPFDIFDNVFKEDTVLFLEDVAEPIYKIDRMLTRLYLAGVLDRVKGLIFGAFTEYKPDRNFNSMEEMIETRLNEWGINQIPVVTGFPTGHQRENLPLIEGGLVNFECGILNFE